MYQDFDEKYVSINFDDGSSATLIQTTLAYWDHDYGKKTLTNEEQLSMYMKPKVSPAIKYLMLDNMQRLVDAGAFIKVNKEEDALKNVKYNYYTKRNVRYTIIFEAGYNDINERYLMDFDDLYNKQLKLLEDKSEEEKNTTLEKTVTIEKVEFKKEEVKEEIDHFLKDAHIEKVDALGDIEEEKVEEKKPIINEEFHIKETKLPKSKVIINEEDHDEEKETKEVDVVSLGDLLEDLDLE